MQKFLNVLLIVLIFTVLQVTNVGAQDTAFPGSAPVGQMDQDCAQLHPGGAATHVDPPESQIEAMEAEYRASCERGNCAISDATYSNLENQGHSRGEVDCFMAEGERDANRGPNDHGDMPGMPGMTGGPGGMPGMGDPCMNMPPGPAQADCYKHNNNHGGPNDHGDMPGMPGMTGGPGGMPGMGQPGLNIAPEPTP